MTPYHQVFLSPNEEGEKKEGTNSQAWELMCTFYLLFVCGEMDSGNRLGLRFSHFSPLRQGSKYYEDSLKPEEVLENVIT